MKKIISFVLAGVFAASIYCVSAKVLQDNPIRNYNDIKITIDGTPVATNDTTEPFIIDGTTYLPVRALAEALGLKVEWDGTTNTVILSSCTDNKVCVTSGSKYHIDNCRYLKKVKIYISKEHAEANGFSPCRVCLGEKE